MSYTYRLLFVSLFLLPVFLSGQSYRISGRIYDGENGQPLPFVNISVQALTTGTTSDIDGRFSLLLPPGKHRLNLSYMGYERQELWVNPNSAKLEIRMQERSTALGEVEIFPGENPAHRIIKNAVAARSKNSPDKLSSFSYKSYSKMVVTVNTDSLRQEIDTIYAPDTDSIVRIDSSGYRIRKFTEGQHLFFLENLIERNFIRDKRDNQTVLASRTSGFKNPLFALASTQMQSFSFYSDYISILQADFLNPITPGSTRRYFFLLEDTTYNSPGDTVYIISFRPQPNYGFKPLEGVVYINSSDWAIQNVIAGPYDSEGIHIRIEQQYKNRGGHWFPNQLHADLRIPGVVVNNLPLEARFRSYLKDIVIEGELRKKDISRALVSIDELATENAEPLLMDYRTDSLDLREQRTYEFMDSLSKAEKLEQQLNYMTVIFQGKLPFGYLDLDLNRTLRVNREEKLRLGLGVHSSKKFSRWFTIGGYFGYGFGDQQMKYGWDSRVELNKANNLALLGGYLYDIFESGQPNFTLRPTQGLFDQNYRQYFIDRYDEVSRYFAGVTYNPSHSFQLEILTRRENRLMRGDYYFAYENEGETSWQNGFNYFELQGAFRYAPREEYVEGSFGSIRLKRSYPVIYGQYTRGLPGVWASDFSYHKADLLVEYLHKTLFLGTLELQLQAGAVSEPLPYSKLYTGTANQRNEENYFKRNAVIAGRFGFETMGFNEFLSSRYLQLMYRQDLESLLFRRGNFSPHIELVARALWGGLDQPDRHREMAFQVPEKGFYEGGIEFNRLSNIAFMGLGLGTYYRFGPYQRPHFSENFAVKLTAKFSF